MPMTNMDGADSASRNASISITSTVSANATLRRGASAQKGTSTTCTTRTTTTLSLYCNCGIETSGPQGSASVSRQGCRRHCRWTATADPNQVPALSGPSALLLKRPQTHQQPYPKLRLCASIRCRRPCRWTAMVDPDQASALPGKSTPVLQR